MIEQERLEQEQLERERKVLQAIDRYVDGEEFQDLIKKTHEKIPSEKFTTQIRGLQNVINTTTRFSEIINFVKSQTGRHAKSEKKHWNDFGPLVLDNLLKFNQKAKKIAKEHSRDYGDIRLKLARHWIKMQVAEYLYSHSQEKDELGSNYPNSTQQCDHQEKDNQEGTQPSKVQAKDNEQNARENSPKQLTVQPQKEAQNINYWGRERSPDSKQKGGNRNNRRRGRR